MSEQNNTATGSRKYPIITISREYGAGGRSIAKAVAEQLGIPYYDKDFMKATAEQSGYSLEDIEREGEELSRSGKILDNILNNVTAYTSSHDAIFKAQVQTILNLAQNDCIIIGRCANLILRDAGVPCFDIFLHTDLEHQLARAKELTDGEQVDDLKKYVQNRVARRETYYKTYTNHELGDYHDYDLILDTGVLGYQNCADLIVDLVKNKGIRPVHPQ